MGRHRTVPARSPSGVSWLVDTTNRMLRCRSVPALLDLACEAIQVGLGYHHVCLALVDSDRRMLVAHTGTAAQGQLRSSPDQGLRLLEAGSDDARLLDDPRLHGDGPGFIFRAAATRPLLPAACAHPDRPPGRSLLVALRTADTVLGLISISDDATGSGRSLTPADAPSLVAFANALTIALENATRLEGQALRIDHLDHDVRRRIAQLEWLRETSRRITAARTLDEVLDVVYDGIREVLGYDRVGIVLFDHASGSWEERRGTDERGQKTCPADRVQALSPESPIWRLPDVAALLRGAEVYYTADAYAETPPDLRHLLDGAPAQQLAVALRSGEAVTGMICVDNLPSGRPIAADEAGPLLALAHQVATAVENARMLERERGERARLAVLLESARALNSLLDRERLLHALAARLVVALDTHGAAFTHVDLTARTIRSLATHTPPDRPSFFVGGTAPLDEYPVFEKVLQTRTPFIGHIADADLPDTERSYLGRWALTAELLVPVVGQGVASGVLDIYWDQPLTITPETVDLCTAIAEQAAVALEHNRLYQDLQESERRLRTVMANTPVILFALDRKGRVTLAEGTGLAALGIAGEAVLGRSVDEIFADAPTIVSSIHRALAGEISADSGAIGNLVFATRYTPLRDEQGEINGVLGVALDVTERTRAEDAVRRVNRALATISACHHAMVRVACEADLLRQVCRSMVEVGGYRLAWVGIPEHDAARTVRPVAHAGGGTYLDSVTISWADGPAGQGPTGTAIRTAHPCVVQDMRADPAYAPWCARALAHGFAASIALPLISGGAVLGVLSIYAGEVGAFDAEETQLLSQLADDLAYGMMALRAQADRSRAEAALRASEERFRALSEQATDLVQVLDRAGVIQYASPSHRRILGHAPEDLLGRTCVDLIHPDDVAQARTPLGVVEREAGVVDVAAYRMRHADGSWRWLEVTANNRLADPAIQGVIINARDVTERVTMEEALRHQALHDALTGLPNRLLLQDRLRRDLLLAGRAHGPLALLLLDLDRFKEVNDTFGHHYGDRLLQQVAERLQAVLRASDTVARLGGDEFAVLLPASDRTGARITAEKIGALLDAPICVEGQALRVGVSIGIALYPEHGTDAETLLRHADVAMYVAKRAGTGQAMYAPAQDVNTPHRLALIGDLREAIARETLRVYYQPKVDLRTGQVRSVEALVRWPHPLHGLIPPDQFIPLAEQTDLIIPLTRCVLAAAARQWRRWSQAGIELGVAVNLSLANVRDAQLAQTILGLLQREDVPAEAFCLELTESVVMADPARTREVLSHLTDRGVHVSIDDFGTGYSSLAALKRLPVDELKIDQSFVRQMVEDDADAAIVASTIGLAHSLDLRVVAEGVEDERTCRRLREMGCDAAQGFYWTRLLPADQLEHWLRTVMQAA